MPASTADSSQPTPGPFPSWAAFTAAPHRLFFWSGALYAAVAVGVWVLQQASLYSGLMPPWVWPLPFAPLHGLMMVYGLMGFFFSGFLSTTYPRWLDQPELPRRVYLPAWLGMSAGAHLLWLGVLLGPGWSTAGALLLLAGQGRLWLAWAGTVRAAAGHPRRGYPVLLLAPLGLGLLGLACAALALGAGWPEGYAAARWLGLYGYLLPVVLSVAWRMVPFFTSTVTPGYEMRRGRGTLPLLFALLLLRGAVGWWGAAPGWAGLADGALALVLGAELVRWRPWQAQFRPLLTVLYLGLGWLWLGFALGAGEGLAVAAGWSALPPFRLAALHAITVGGFGTLLLGIGTRVSLGHSGRGLATARWHNALFLAYQAVPVSRVLPDILGHWWPTWAVQSYWSGVGWVLAFALWLLLFDRTLRSPRSDGRPG